jgi:hypothetical protein
MVTFHKNIFLVGIIFMLVFVLVFVRYKQEGLESIYTKKAKTDYPSNRSTVSSATSSAKCQTECDDLPDCTGYIFSTKTPACSLKSGELKQATENEWTDAYIKTPQGAPSVRTSVSSAAAAAPSVSSSRSVMAASTTPAALPYDDFYIGPVKYPSSIEACQLECDNTSTCSGTVVLNQGTNQSFCYLKSVTEVPNGQGHIYVGRTKNPYTNSVQDNPKSDDYYISKYVSEEGVSNVKSIEACQSKCDEDKECAGIFYQMFGATPHCSLQYTDDPKVEGSIRIYESMGKTSRTSTTPASAIPYTETPIVRYSATV